ncbi:MAG TPA: adenosylmethionine--8-amino-7-oxononanoate transaminase [Verrucomicrobiae bacterium]|nr:adenosylmethionine--8-amino-7-oxononanoate transaminase [Verrucomicrobiae bacterium]
MHRLAKLDHQYIWHPFTQMRDWLKHEPIVIARGKGAVLEDVDGRKYLDANSSIWTNLHGHNHPKINAAIKRQLRRIAHSSALGLANESASLLARELAKATKLDKVFFSDDGSTAMEVALKLAYEVARRKGLKPRFLSLEGAYHGDTVGAVSLGHIDLFHKSYSGLLFNTDKVMAPYCYRCPFNRAKPERADAREYRKCNWECVGKVEQQFRKHQYSAFVIEPLIQGAAGMIPQPQGWLRRVTEIARAHGTQIIADEVMTGFGRTGSLFACQQEGVHPDFIALAKGLTGGYLPMAATLTTQVVFDAFLGDYSEFKTFFHGHSYTANQLASAAALASFKMLNTPASIRARRSLEANLRAGLYELWDIPSVGDIRQIGLIAGIELVKNWRTREPFDLREQAGIRVCQAMARRGVLTRPIGNVVVIMPPYCTTEKQASQIIAALRDGINVLGRGL